MPEPSIRRAFWLGVRDSLPFLIIIVPFGMLFGVVAAEAGWPLARMPANTAPHKKIWVTIGRKRISVPSQKSPR